MLFDPPHPSLILYDTGSPVGRLPVGEHCECPPSQCLWSPAVRRVEGESVFLCGSQGSHRMPLPGTEYRTLISTFFTKQERRFCRCTFCQENDTVSVSYQPLAESQLFCLQASSSRQGCTRPAGSWSQPATVMELLLGLGQVH